MNKYIINFITSLCLIMVLLIILTYNNTYAASDPIMYAQNILNHIKNSEIANNVRNMTLSTIDKIEAAKYNERFTNSNSNSNSNAQTSLMIEPAGGVLTLYYRTDSTQSQMFMGFENMWSAESAKGRISTWNSVKAGLPANLNIEEVECSGIKGASLCGAFGINVFPALVLKYGGQQYVYSGDYTYKNIAQFLRDNSGFVLNDINKYADAVHLNLENIKPVSAHRKIEPFHNRHHNRHTTTTTTTTAPPTTTTTTAPATTTTTQMTTEDEPPQIVDADNQVNYGSITDPETIKSLKAKCPPITFDKKFDQKTQKYSYQIFNPAGQHGYVTGGNAPGDMLTPFNAAYSTFNTYLTSLPDPTPENMQMCASIYQNAVAGFGLCDKTQLDNILQYDNKKARVPGTDYKSHIPVVSAIKSACHMAAAPPS